MSYSLQQFCRDVRQVLADGASRGRVEQVREYTDMTEWERTDEGSNAEYASLREKRRYRLNPGEAGVYYGSELHSISLPDNVRYLRVTGTDLEKVERLRIDAASGRIQRVRARQSGAG
jgi:hypothetical protein